MSNASNGAEFERQMCELLASHGFWTHRIVPNRAGQQPADIIAVKGNYHTLIDCKVISTRAGFPFSRIEDNQLLAMERFDARAIHQPWFALRMPSGAVRMLSYSTALNMMDYGRTGLTNNELLEDHFTKSLDDWLTRFGK